MIDGPLTDPGPKNLFASIGPPGEDSSFPSKATGCNEEDFLVVVVVEEVVPEIEVVEEALPAEAVVSPTTTEEGQTLLENLKESLAEAGQVKRKSKTRRRRKSKSKDTRKRKK